MIKLPSKDYADLLMLCGALHDIAEILQMQIEHNPFQVSRLHPQVNLASHVRTVEQKLEKIVSATSPISTQQPV